MEKDEVKKTHMEEPKSLIVEKNSFLECFLGDETKIISSKDVMEELKIHNDENISDLKYEIGQKTYTIEFPIPVKAISIINKHGKLYKSMVYFPDDIKNILTYLKIENPWYETTFKERKKIQEQIDYGIFLFDIDAKEIKDICEFNLDYQKLNQSYHTLFKVDLDHAIGHSLNLLEINPNIKIYSKLDIINKETYFPTCNRQYLELEIQKFYQNPKREKIEDLIYGICGNYTSGKSIFLMNYNYKATFPITYLNLKYLQKSEETQGFIDLLTKELMNFFYKLKKSYEEYELFIKNTLTDHLIAIL